MIRFTKDYESISCKMRCRCRMLWLIVRQTTYRTGVWDYDSLKVEELAIDNWAELCRQKLQESSFFIALARRLVMMAVITSSVIVFVDGSEILFKLYQTLIEIKPQVFDSELIITELSMNNMKVSIYTRSTGTLQTKEYHYPKTSFHMQATVGNHTSTNLPGLCVP